MSRKTILTINQNALKHNLATIKSLAPHALIQAMVKADAYGHGIIEIAKGLADADSFGVASIEEGILLREAGVTQPIMLMEGIFEFNELKEAEHYEMTLVVHHAWQVSALEKVSAQKPFSVWLKLNTGMNRLGVLPHEFLPLYERLQNLSVVKKPIGLMTHFASSEIQNSEMTRIQTHLFRSLTENLPGPKSLANSGAIILHPELHADWVRPGLILYGASPIPNQTAGDVGLQPVMTLSSRIISIVPVKPGQSVGYGSTWAASKETTVGVIAAGYGDGYPQLAGEGVPVLVNGKTYPLVGRVSMDMLTIDLGITHQHEVGDPVILWGDGLPVEVVAKASGSTPYELLTRMTHRPIRQVIG